METIEEYQQAYAESSKEAKRLKAELDRAQGSLELLRTDPRYQPVRDLINKIDNNESAPEPKKEEKKDDGVPEWAKVLFMDFEERKKEREAQRRTKFAEWEAGVIKKEEAFLAKFPELKEYVGVNGKIDAYMKARGEDDWDVAARAVLPVEHLAAFIAPPEPEAEEKKTPKRSDKPVEGKVVKTEEARPVNYEQAKTLAFQRFSKDPRVAGAAGG